MHRSSASTMSKRARSCADDSSTAKHKRKKIVAPCIEAPSIRICQSAMKLKSMLSDEVIAYLSDQNLQLSGNRRAHFTALIKTCLKCVQFKRVFNYDKNDPFKPNALLHLRNLIKKHMMSASTSKMTCNEFLDLVHDTIFSSFSNLDLITKTSVYKCFLNHKNPLKSWMIRADTNTNNVQPIPFMMLHFLSEIIASCFLIIYNL